MATQQQGPTRAGYLFAGLIFLLGLAGSAVLAVLFVVGLIGLGSSLERVVVPGSARLEFSEAGRYTIFYEYRSEVGGFEYRTGETPPDLLIRVVNADTGEEIPVQSRSGVTTYELSDYAGVSLQAFRVDEPGTYELTAEYRDGRSEPEIVLAIGEGVGQSILTSVGAFFASGAIFCGSTILALILVAVTFFRRARVKDARQPGQI